MEDAEWPGRNKTPCIPRETTKGPPIWGGEPEKRSARRVGASKTLHLTGLIVQTVEIRSLKSALFNLLFQSLILRL